MIAALLAGALSASAALPPEQEAAVRAAYEKLGSAGVESKPAATLPKRMRFHRIDVSEHMRSASFGHKTMLIVPVQRADGGAVAPTQFWVEYGASTNNAARLFGPFPVDR
jgi:hypothetical protein